MCQNIIILYCFMFLKIVFIFILPIIIFIKRKKKISNILIIVNIIILLYILLCNLFGINGCIYRSNFNGISMTKEQNFINHYNILHPKNDSSEEIKPEKMYVTATGRNLYYFNQNKEYLKTSYYVCNNKKIYMNSFGSSITSLSTAISTLYDNNINPVQILNFYKTDNSDLCNMKFDINSIFNSITKRYGAITLSNINSDRIKDEVKNGGIVIAEVFAKEGSKLTCDHDYLVIYNISLNGNLMIVSPSSTSNPYICSYSSRAYGSTIDYNNFNNISLDELKRETINYYLIKKV